MSIVKEQKGEQRKVAKVLLARLKAPELYCIQELTGLKIDPSTWILRGFIRENDTMNCFGVSQSYHQVVYLIYVRSDVSDETCQG